MRLAAICSCIVIGCGLASCGTSSASPGSGSGGSAGDGGVASDGGGSSTDAGTGQGGASDAGTAADGGGDSGSGGGSDGGSGGGGGGSGGTGDGGSGGTTASDCDGLMPAAPGAPLQFRWAGRDLVNGSCSIGDVDGTGHIALLWQDNNQPGDSHYLFVDSSTGSSAGSYTGTWLLGLIGQLSGFMGADCFDTYCTQGDYVVLSPTGAQVGSLLTVTGMANVTNVAFGGHDHKTLYVTAGKSIFRVPLAVSGYALFPPKP